MGFDQILEMKKAVEEAEPIEQILCPLCAYPLEDSDRGKHCSWCGWHEGLARK